MPIHSACTERPAFQPHLPTRLLGSRLPSSSGAAFGFLFGSRLRFRRRPILQIRTSDSCRMSPLQLLHPINLGSRLDQPSGLAFEPSNRLTTRSSVAEHIRIERSVHASANRVTSVYSVALIGCAVDNSSECKGSAPREMCRYCIVSCSTNGRATAHSTDGQLSSHRKGRRTASPSQHTWLILIGWEGRSLPECSLNLQR